MPFGNFSNFHKLQPLFVRDNVNLHLTLSHIPKKFIANSLFLGTQAKRSNSEKSMVLTKFKSSVTDHDVASCWRCSKSSCECSQCSRTSSENGWRLARHDATESVCNNRVRHAYLPDAATPATATATANAGSISVIKISSAITTVKEGTIADLLWILSRNAALNLLRPVWLKLTSTVTELYFTVALVAYCLSLPLCLEWYNGSITPQVHSAVTKRIQCWLHYRPSAPVE